MRYFELGFVSFCVFKERKWPKNPILLYYLLFITLKNIIKRTMLYYGTTLLKKLVLYL